MRRRFDKLDEVWPAGLAKRLGAMVYDGLLVLAIWIGITTAHVAWVRLVLEQPPETVGDDLAQVLSLRLALALSAYAFFAFSWTRGGMTLGMQAWRLRVQTDTGLSITWTQSLVRYLVAWVSLAAFGLGYWWILFDEQKRSWSDIASGTRVVVVPKAAG
ncbi:MULTISPECIES: RDD family protein [Halomonas]|uniref:RDD family protein n=1 Tax=Halomonas chromatireducens TaxID=507626 RepID=A0A109UMM0_9GAMM|nr:MULTISPECIES: RDD family protein [Halomonas]AMD01956.1 RDD family protein [Halomonas chromatireducens]MBZ0331050.1 RDD family protein [Halomonas sp. ANAO-440]